MPKLSTLNPGARRRVLAYGKTGSGKTVFALSFPPPIYVADFDDKISSGAAFYAGEKRLEQIDYDSYAFPGGFNKFDEWIRKAAADASPTPVYQTIVVDSLTTMIQIMLDDFMQRNGAIQRTRTSAGTIPSMLDYRAIAMQIRSVFQRLFSLPAHIVCVAHVRTDKNELTGEIINGPEAPASIATYLPVIFEEVYRTYVEEAGGKRTYKAQTQADQRYPARSQIRGMPGTIDLTYDSLKKFGGT